MLRTTLRGLFIGACGLLAGMAPLQAAPAEPVGQSMSAFNDIVTVNSQKQTIAARVSNATVTRAAHRGGHDRDSALRARNSFGADQWRGGLRGELVGGTFALPYYNYCIGRPGDQNC
jgi:hypothetical protein